MTPELRIVVHGTPGPQGSKRHLGNGVMIESSEKVKPWRQDVRAAAIEAIENGGPTFPKHVGVILGVGFRFPRPKSHYRSGRYSHLLRPGAPPRPAVYPDASKLVRSTEDALTEAGVWHDDAQVVRLFAAKDYDDHGKGVGATIIVRAASVLDEPGYPLLRVVPSEHTTQEA